MNRKEAKKIVNDRDGEDLKLKDYDFIIKLVDKIYDDFEKDLKDIHNQVSRLKKQLANDHHIECMCSFCKPVNENVKEFIFTSCDDCKNKINGFFQEVCSNCKRFYGCHFEKKEM